MDVRTNSGVTKIPYKVPGVMVMDWYPNLGTSHSPTDPASVLGKEMYARVRAAYSGTLRADAPDYVMYVAALDSLFAYIAWMKRLYRTLSAFNPENYVVPDVLLSAMGLSEADIQSLRANKTQLWQLTNELVHQSRKFTCPSSLDIMNRHYWMSDNVYTDAPSLKGQVYLFNLKGVFQYEENGIVNESGEIDGTIKASGLSIRELPWIDRTKGSVITPQILYNFGLGLIDALVAWDESYTISGYLQRAYEGTPGFVVAELDQNEVLTPVYMPEVLMQIENSMTTHYAGSMLGRYWGIVRQQPSTNAVWTDPQFWVKQADVSTNLRTTATYSENKLPHITMRVDNPTVIDTVEATRLSSMATYKTEAKMWPGDETGAQTIITIPDAGTEVPVGWYVIMTTGSSGDDVVALRKAGWFRQTGMFAVTTSGVATFTNDELQTLAASEAFDWHPLAYMVSGDGKKAIFMGDVHNITTISKEDMENLHRICAFSEFNSFTMM